MMQPGCGQMALSQQHSSRDAYRNAPPPYPGVSAGSNFYQPGFRQSFSGSETSTDMSFSSSENLDCCSLRQEPQGAETHRLFQNTFDPIVNVNGSDTYSILSRLGMPQSALEVKAPDPSTFYAKGSATPMLVVDGELDTHGYPLHPMAVDSSGTQTHAIVGAHPVMNQQINQMSAGQHQEIDADDRSYSLLPLPNQLNEKSDDANLLLRWHQQQQQCRSPSGRSSRSPVPQARSPVPQTNNAFVEPSAQCNHGSDGRIEEWGTHVMKGTATATSMPANENWHQLDAAMSASTRHMTMPTTLPNALVSNSTSIKNVLTNMMEQPRPATAPITGRHAKLLNVQPPDHHENDSNMLIRSGKFRRSYERFDRTVRTHSQPDLTRLAMLQLAAPSDTMQLQRNQQINGSIESTDSLSFDELTTITNGFARKSPPELNHAAIATRATQMVERLSEENRALRSELDGYYKKVCKLQKFEMEIEKVRSGYESLVKQSQRREHLEKLMRYKLENEIKKLCGMNAELQDHLNQALTQLLQSEGDQPNESEVTKELHRKDSLMSKLISQNRELLASKDRLQLEVASHRSTTLELRTHIDVLSDALTTTRSTTKKYEEEIQHRHAQEVKVDDLQKTLVHMKFVNGKREIVHQQIRSKLQDEIRSLKEQKANRNMVAMEMDEGIASDSESPTSMQSLIRQIHDKEQRVQILQAEVVKWEQKFLEDSVSKQFAIDASSVTQDSYFSAAASAALEFDHGCETVNDATVRHLQHIYEVDRKCLIDEAKLKSLQIQLAEKEALIRMMGSSLDEQDSLSSCYSSRLNSKHPSMSSLSSLTASQCGSYSSSQMDNNCCYALVRPDQKSPVHSKSNSLGSSLPGDIDGDVTLGPIKDGQFRLLQCHLSTQVALHDSVQSGSDQFKEFFWQV